MLILAKFDVRAGHQVVWSSAPIEPGSLPGVEFRMIPSGLHDAKEDTIYFQCGDYSGCSVYMARTSGSDRANAHLYALALVVHNSKSQGGQNGNGGTMSAVPWSQETYLKYELAKFMDVLDPSVITVASDGFVSPDPKCHPILNSTSFIQTYGALVFELWKCGLSRQRLLLAHPASTTESETRRAVSLRDLSQYSYLVSRICSIPADIQHLLSDRRQHELEYPCFYNVGLQDMPRLQGASSYIATTSDGLLLSSSREACDVWTDAVTVNVGNDKLRPTWRDRRRFSKLVESLNIDYEPPPHHNGNLSWGGIMDRLVDSTSSGLMWWASAGESAIMEQEDRQAEPLLGINLNNTTVPTNASTNALTTNMDGTLGPKADGVAMIGYFQQYTRQLIRVFSRLTQDDDGMIMVGPEHIAAMGLDPVAQQDRKFLQRFSIVWWDRPVYFRDCCCCQPFI